MTEENNVAQPVATEVEKINNKELNFRALEQKLQQERNARLEAEKARQEAERRYQEAQRYFHKEEEEDEDDEPYVDKKRLQKQLDKFGQQTFQRTQQEIQNAVAQALEKERMEGWIKQNPDFFDVMNHADKLHAKDPELAETILKMPDNFERQKLVYKQIKHMGLHEAPRKEPTAQEKINANRKTPYYQPSSVGSAPYGNSGDFSSTGQKNAYEQMQALKNRLRLG